MGILEQKNCVRNSISKIPEYARNFKNEYLFFYLKEYILILRKMKNLMKVILMIIQDIEIFMSCFVNFMIK